MITEMDLRKSVLPLISIIIPTYKRAAFLSRAVDSALNQSYPNIEVIVVDDNEPDSVYRAETEKVMELYSKEYRVHYIKHSHNQNGAAARNTGIRHCEGEYVCFLDDDDWYLTEKVERQYQFLKEQPEYTAVYCGWERDGKKVYPNKSGDLSFELLSGISIIYTNTIMIKREKAVECGGWDERFRRNQEAVFLLRFFSLGEQIGTIPNVLVVFDISDDQNRSNPVQVEKDFDMFLEYNQPAIKRCIDRYPEAYDKIYSYRYRGVLLNYLKHGRLIYALILYKKMSKLLHKRFRRDCILYFKRRLLGQCIFGEYEKENPII